MVKSNQLVLALIGLALLPINLIAMEAPALAPSMLAERPFTELRPIDSSRLPFFMIAPIYLGLAEAYRQRAETQRDANARKKDQLEAKSLYQIIANKPASTLKTFGCIRMMECYLNEGHYERALVEAEKVIAQKDDTSARWIGKLRLGQMLILGQGVSISRMNVRKGMTLLEEVADQTENGYARQLANAYLNACSSITWLQCNYLHDRWIDRPIESAECRALINNTAHDDNTVTQNQISSCETISQLNETVKKLRFPNYAPSSAYILGTLRLAESGLAAKERHGKLAFEEGQRISQDINEICDLVWAQRISLFPLLGPSAIGLWHPRAAGLVTLMGMVPLIVPPMIFPKILNSLTDKYLDRIPSETMRPFLHTMIENIFPVSWDIGLFKVWLWLCKRVVGRYPEELFPAPLCRSDDQIESLINRLANQNVVPTVKENALVLQANWKWQYESRRTYLNFIHDALEREKPATCLQMIKKSWVMPQVPENYQLVGEILQRISQLLNHEDIDLRDRIEGKLKLSLSLFDERMRHVFDDNVQRSLNELNALLEVEGLKGFEYQPSPSAVSNAELSAQWRKRIAAEIPALREELFEINTLFEAVTALRNFIQPLVPNFPAQQIAIVPQPADQPEPGNQEEQWQAMRTQEDRRRHDAIRARTMADEARLEEFARECEEKNNN